MCCFHGFLRNFNLLFESILKCCSTLCETMQSEDCTPSLAQAQRMKKLSQDGRLNMDVIFSILTEEKPNQKEKFNIRRERIDRFFPNNFTEKQKEDLIVQLLENWYKKRQREQER